jgi:tripartite-type tricarboxylate transporter receptor subunit TctC
MMAGIDIVHVPCRGTAQALTALVAGRVQLMFDDISSSIAHIRAGRLRALAVTTTERSEFLPNVATVGEFLPGFESTAFFGVGAPKGTPDDVTATLNREINAGLAEARISARLAEVGGPVHLPGSLGHFARLIRDETKKWSNVVAFAHIKVE